MKWKYGLILFLCLFFIGECCAETYNCDFHLVDSVTGNNLDTSLVSAHYKVKYWQYYNSSGPCCAHYYEEPPYDCMEWICINDMINFLESSTCDTNHACSITMTDFSSWGATTGCYAAKYRFFSYQMTNLPLNYSWSTNIPHDGLLAAPATYQDEMRDGTYYTNVITEFSAHVIHNSTVAGYVYINGVAVSGATCYFYQDGVYLCNTTTASNGFFVKSTFCNNLTKNITMYVSKAGNFGNQSITLVKTPNASYPYWNGYPFDLYTCSFSLQPWEFYDNITTVSGYVFDNQTGLPIVNALVEATTCMNLTDETHAGSSIFLGGVVYTDETGYYYIDNLVRSNRTNGITPTCENIDLDIRASKPDKYLRNGWEYTFKYQNFFANESAYTNINFSLDHYERYDISGYVINGETGDIVPNFYVVELLSDSGNWYYDATNSSGYYETDTYYWNNILWSGYNVSISPSSTDYNVSTLIFLGTNPPGNYLLNLTIYPRKESYSYVDGYVNDNFGNPVITEFGGGITGYNEYYTYTDEFGYYYVGFCLDTCGYPTWIDGCTPIDGCIYYIGTELDAFISDWDRYDNISYFIIPGVDETTHHNITLQNYETSIYGIVVDNLTGEPVDGTYIIVNDTDAYLTPMLSHTPGSFYFGDLNIGDLYSLFAINPNFTLDSAVVIVDKDENCNKIFFYMDNLTQNYDPWNSGDYTLTWIGGNYTWNIHDIFNYEYGIYYQPVTMQLQFVDQYFRPIDSLHVTQTPMDTTYENWSVLDMAYKIKNKTGFDPRAVNSGTTGSDGTIIFPSLKPIYYKLDAVDTSRNISFTKYITTGEDKKIIIIPLNQSTTTAKDMVIKYSVEGEYINGTFFETNVTYRDITNQTGSLTEFVKYSNGTTIFENTYTNVNNASYKHIFNVTNGEEYQYGFTSTNTLYGQTSKINYLTAHIAFGALTPDYVKWIAVGVMVLLGTLFSVYSVRTGLIIISLMAIFIWGVGWLDIGLYGGIITISLLILAILSYIRNRENINT